MIDHNLKDRLCEVLTEEGRPLAEIADDWGLDPSSLAKQARGERGVSVATVQAILAHRPETNPDWLLHGKGRRTTQDSDAGRQQRLPLLPIPAMAGTGLAGGAPAVTHDQCEMREDADAIARGAELLVKVEGDSMEPAYHSGDILAIRRMPSPPRLRSCEAYVFDTAIGAMLKRYIGNPPGTQDNGTMTLRSDNILYPDIHIDKTDIYAIHEIV